MKDRENNIEYISLKHRDITKKKKSEVRFSRGSIFIVPLSASGGGKKQLDVFHQPT